MLSAQAVGSKPEAALDAGCAIEMLHCFSLIHDDLPAIDNDDTRRGRPTCHVKFGEAVAILAGDALFALAMQTMAHSSPDPARALAATQILARASGSDGLVGGETVDILSEGKTLNLEQVRWIHERKTAALIAASCEIGAVMGGATVDVAARFQQFGAGIGLAFQIADDVLNETSTAEQLGKSAGSDRERAKATYPAVLGVDASREMARELVERAKATLGDHATPALRAVAAFAVERMS
jgi:geranylgeranyl diphosphate synthase type II